MEDLITRLKSCDNDGAYKLMQSIRAESAASDIYAGLIDSFTELVRDKSSYVRTRGFVLACAQARWDEEGKLGENLGTLLTMLHDGKPTAVRQCLSAMHELVLYRPELNGEIRKALAAIDLSQYKDSMAPLIKKDIEELINIM